MNTKAEGFKNIFGVLSRFVEKRLTVVFRYQMSPWAKHT